MSDPRSLLPFTPRGTSDLAGSDRTVQLWDVASGEPYGQPMIGAGSDFQFSPDGKFLASRDMGESGATVQLWDVASRQPYGQPMIGAGSDFQFSPDGKFLAA